MRSARLPANEHARLAALRRYNVLDSVPEEAFDRIVRIVRDVFDVPTAVVSLVDADRQWFKARVGLDAAETPRDIAFCAHAILKPTPMLVLDATCDERFHDNPLVTCRDGVRFYAGAPIRTRDGFNIGILCATDSRPHDEAPSAEQMSTLCALAAVTADELELRAKMRELAEALESRTAAEAALAASDARLKDYLETATDWLWESDEAHRFTSILAGNGRLASGPSFVGQTRLERAGGDPDDPAWVAHLADLAAHRPFSSFCYSARDPSGQTARISVSGKPLFDGDGTFRGYRGTSRDITMVVERENALRDLSQRLSLLSTSGVIGMMVCEADRLVEANDEFLRIVGRPGDDIAGLDWPDLLPEGQRANDAAVADKVFATGRFATVEMECVRQDGERIPVAVSWVCLEPGARRRMALVEDISERKSADAKIRALAFCDTLTGLLNRRSFEDELVRRIAGGSPRDTTGAVLMIDLDYFKDVNDTLGHDAGDALIQDIGLRLKSAIRDHDAVARLGGDEFAVVLSGIHDRGDILAIAERIIVDCQSPFEHASQIVHTSASIGIAVYPEDGNEPKTLLKCADMALYRAKAAGRRSAAFFDPTMTVLTVARTQLVAELRQAIDAGQLRMFYQPIVALDGRRPAGFEALVRWQHPERGLLGPSTFLDAATTAGLGRELCAFTLGTAMAQMRTWLDRGLDPGRMAVNLSAYELSDHGIALRIAALLSAHRLPPDCFEIEVTESVVIADDPLIEANLESLHQLGVRIALDDFGTGYSSLSHLKRFTVDTLKIDASFVRDMVTDPDDAAIVRAIIRLAHTLDLTVVAEGIETESQMHGLRELGCDFGQGYLIARPAAADDIAIAPCQPSSQRGRKQAGIR
jgi:diguanylate cyclase (GGDEF)-like protein/PAS domain S-box-containing protein